VGGTTKGRNKEAEKRKGKHADHEESRNEEGVQEEDGEVANKAVTQQK